MSFVVQKRNFKSGGFMSKFLLILVCLSIFISCKSSKIVKNQPVQKIVIQKVKIDNLKFVNNLKDEFNSMKFSSFYDSYNEKMKKAFPKEKSNTFFNSIFKKTGKILEIERSYKKSENTYVYIAKCDKAYLLLTISYKKNKIQGLWANVAPLKLHRYRQITENMIAAYNEKNYQSFMKYYNSKMSDALPLAKTKKFIDNLHNRHGKAKTIGPEKMIIEIAWRFPIEFEKNFMNFNISFDKQDKIQGLRITPKIKPVKYPKINEKTTIADIAKAYMLSPIAAGLAIGVYQNGKTKLYTFGEKIKGSGKSIDTNSKFEIGSITKTFTGAMLYQMIKEGKIKLNDPIQKFFPSNVSIPKFEGETKEITIKDIVTHTSSLPRLPGNLSKHSKDPENPYKDYTNEHIKEFLNNYKLKREIGSKYEYSNLAIGILGNILAVLDGKT